MTDKRNSPVDDLRGELETDRAADALCEYVAATGLAALEKSQEYGAPQYQLTPRMRKRLLRALDREQRGRRPHRKAKARLMLIAALLAALFAATQASAIRAWFGNYFLSQREESVDLSERAAPENEYSYMVPKPTAIPEGFRECPEPDPTGTDVRPSYSGFYEIPYRNGAGEEITYSVYADSASLRLDGEGAKEREKVAVNGESGVCIVKKGRVNLTWGKYPPLQLRGPARLKEELFQMAESVHLPEESGSKYKEVEIYEENPCDPADPDLPVGT